MLRFVHQCEGEGFDLRTELLLILVDVGVADALLVVELGQEIIYTQK